MAIASIGAHYEFGSAAIFRIVVNELEAVDFLDVDVLGLQAINEQPGFFVFEHAILVDDVFDVKVVGPVGQDVQVFAFRFVFLRAAPVMRMRKVIGSSTGISAARR